MRRVDDIATDRKAFTLLEVLLAMMLTALLAGSLYASLRTAFVARRSAEGATGPARTLQLAMTLVEQDLRAAVAPNGILAGAFDGQDAGGPLAGGSDSLNFYAARPGGSERPGVGGVAQVGLLCTEGDSGDQPVLVRQVTANLLAPVAREPAQEVLCRNIRQFNLRYHDGTDWLDSWDSASHDNALPLAVEITLEVGPQEESSLPVCLTRIISLPCGVWPEQAGESSSPGGGG
jgi:type II secretion system protein J